MRASAVAHTTTDLLDGGGGAGRDGDFNDEVVLVEVGHSPEEMGVGYAVDVEVDNVRPGR